jgi:hypothetical protein
MHKQSELVKQSPLVYLQIKSYTIRNSIVEMLPPLAGQDCGIVLSNLNLVISYYELSLSMSLS